jgi:ADP-ribosyl-[dinitrogen reductase] hydrolase
MEEAMTEMQMDVITRGRAALIGMAVGYALGGPVEFMTGHEIAARYGTLAEMTGGGWLRLKPGQVTDDTEMSLCIARAIAETGVFSLPAVAEHFATWLRTGPVDVGDTCRRGIRNFMLHGVLETPPNEWDAGNGALMRMTPVALFTLGDDHLLEECSRAQAHLTHNHPRSDAACLHYGKLLHLALRGRSKARLQRESNEFTALFPSFRYAPYPGLSSGYVVDTMQTVLHHFFRSRSFEECVISTVNQGGDADTTGAIAGGLAGAYYGLEDIPTRWLRKMDRKVIEELSWLGEQLVRLSPLQESVGLRES